MATIHPPTEIPPARTAMPPPSPMPDPSPIPPPSSAPVEEAQLPFAGYDRAGEQQLIHGLSEHTQVELEAAESYERSHKQREAVLNKLRYLRGDEPLPGYDALDVEEVVAALEAASPEVIRKVRGYERKFQQRTRVLDEVVRIQHARRAAEPPRVVPGYLPGGAKRTGT